MHRKLRKRGISIRKTNDCSIAATALEQRCQLLHNDKDDARMAQRKMRALLFLNAKKLEEENLPNYAQTMGLDMTAFDSCLASDRHLAGIDKSTQDAGGVQITGTPHLCDR